MNRSRVAVVLLVGLALSLSRCGGDKATGPSIPTSLLRVGGDGQAGSVGQALPSVLRVKVTDANGSGVEGVIVAWAVASGGGSLSASADTTDATGTAVVSLTLGTTACAHSVTATIAGIPSISPVTFSATAAPGPASKLAFVVQPSDVTAGVAFSPPIQVAVQDAFGNTVTTASTSITMSLGANPGSGTLAGTTSAAAAGGVATFASLSINRPGAGYTLTAAAAGLAGATSVTLTVAVGAASKLAFSVQPTSATAGTALTPAVQVLVQDALGNAVSSSTAAVTLAIASGTGTAGATLSGTLTKAAVGGVATFSDLSLDKVGTSYALSASASGLANSTSGVFAVSPGPASKLVFSAQPTIVSAGGVVGPAVEVSVQDAQGNAVTSSTADVTVSITSGTGATGATLSGTRTAAAVAGVATFSDLSIDKAGTGYTIDAGSSGLSSATSAAFDVYAFSALSASGQTCAIATNGAAYCWGDNDYGALGNGSTVVYSAIPVPVSGGLRFASLSAGGQTCGLTAAGLAYCWGLNLTGGLGDGTKTNRSTPVAVSGGLTFVQVSAGGGHSCGVTSDGAAWCWGFNGYGELGNGSSGAISGSGANSTTPVAVLGGLSFAAVSAASMHTCGLTTTGAAYCWGDNSFGQLGDGTDSTRTTPVAVLGGLSFAALSAGGDHTCGLMSTGAAYCWGYGAQGQLGDGAGASSWTPVAVSGNHAFASLSAKGSSNCGMTTAGVAYCWGENVRGELGNGTWSGSRTPVAVSGGLTFATLDLGGAHACGVTIAGVAYCWGSNGRGMLGDGTAADSPVPVRVH